MKKRIVFIGPYSEDTSLGIYARILMKYLDENPEYEIIDSRRDLTGLSGRQCIKLAIKDLFLTVFSVGFEK